MRNYIRTILSNPRTSLSGLALVLAIAAYLFNLITREQLEVSAFVATSYGLLSARDGKPVKAPDQLPQPGQDEQAGA